MGIVGIKLRAVLKKTSPENGSSVVILYYLRINIIY